MAVNLERYAMTTKQSDIRIALQYQPGKSADFTLDVDLSLPGEGVSAIYGESGSGKTTLLRCIAGLVPAQGRIEVNGTLWQHSSAYLPAHKRPISYVFQESSLLPHLSAEDNIHYALKRARHAHKPDEVKAIIDIMGIGACLQQRPHELSGGQRQRVAIARALASQPRLLLMDEPLAALDQSRKREILNHLEQVKQELRTPILYVSHSLEEIARLSDHIIIMDKGRISESGELSEVFERSNIAQRLGSQSGVVLKAQVSKKSPQWQLNEITFDGGSLWVKDNQEAIEANIRLRIMARDVSITLTPSQDSSIQNRLHSRIIKITEDKDEAMALVHLKCGESTIISRLTKKSVHDLKLATDMQVWAQIKSVAILN